MINLYWKVVDFMNLIFEVNEYLLAWYLLYSASLSKEIDNENKNKENIPKELKSYDMMLLDKKIQQYEEAKKKVKFYDNPVPSLPSWQTWTCSHSDTSAKNCFISFVMFSSDRISSL